LRIIKYAVGIDTIVLKFLAKVLSFELRLCSCNNRMMVHVVQSSIRHQVVMKQFQGLVTVIAVGKLTLN